MSSIVYPETKVYLDVIVRNPEHILYQGQALAVSSVSDKGPLDILEYHANFIGMIKNYVIVHHIDKTQQKILLEKGIVKVFENHVDVFLGVETLEDAMGQK